MLLLPSAFVVATGVAAAAEPLETVFAGLLDLDRLGALRDPEDPFEWPLFEWPLFAERPTGVVELEGVVVDAAGSLVSDLVVLPELALLMLGSSDERSL